MRKTLLATLFFAVLGPLCPQWARADAMTRLPIAKLAATHAAVEALAGERKPVELASGYTDYRAILHSHSKFSHDSRAEIDEILKAAKAVGVQVIMFTEHPADHYDYFRDGHTGLRDGVLLVPGAETNGYHAYPTRSIQGEKTTGPQEFADVVRRDDGLIFLCHLEERMDWEITGLTGTEIYNTHADVKEEKRFMASIMNPLTMLSLMPALEKYPQELFAAIQDYPADYLRRWDYLCTKSRMTGVAGNDSHHNQGVRATLQENGKVLLEDRLGKRLAELDPQKLSLLKPMVKDRKPGDVVLEIDLDPYERSYHHVSTHLLMHEQTQAAVWEALKAGHAYVGFDWMADPTGFVFLGEQNVKRLDMGSEVPDAKGITLKTAAPLPGLIKIVRNGEIIKEERARHLELPVNEPGNYRVEVWLNLAGELRPWILSNPIYVRGEQVAQAPAAAESAADAPTDGTFQTSDGLKIHYLELNHPEPPVGAPVILIHGYTGMARGNWFANGIAQALGKHHRVVAIDCRGHGESDKPHEPEKYGAQMPRDVIELMDHLKIDRAHVHGYSMGGMITAELLATHPERFVTAAFGGSGVGEVDPEQKAKVPADNRGPDPQEAEASAKLRGLENQDRDALAAARNFFTTRDERAKVDLSTIKIPVLAINGEFDGPNSKTHRLARELANFRGVVLPGKSHLTAIMAGYMPPLYLDSLVKFIDEHDPAMAGSK